MVAGNSSFARSTTRRSDGNETWSPKSVALRERLSLDMLSPLVFDGTRQSGRADVSGGRRLPQAVVRGPRTGSIDADHPPGRRRPGGLRSYVVLNGYVLRLLRLPLWITLDKLDCGGGVAQW
jgi:hypothetical protein